MQGTIQKVCQAYLFKFKLLEVNMGGLEKILTVLIQNLVYKPKPTCKYFKFKLTSAKSDL